MFKKRYQTIPDMEEVSPKRNFTAFYFALGAMGFLILCLIGVAVMNQPVDTNIFNAVHLTHTDFEKIVQSGSIKPATSSDISGESLKQHHTSKYRFKKLERLLVVRRGAPFILSVDVPGLWHKKELVAAKATPRFGSAKLHANASIVDVNQVSGAQAHTEFELQITTPSNAPIGVYNITLCFSHSEDAVDLSKVECFSTDGLAVLFNPWSPEDETYLEDNGGSQLAEYVENDYGTIWRGSLGDVQGTRWYYGQFEEYVFHSVLHFISNFSGDFSSPIHVSRYVAGVLGACDDQGMPPGCNHHGLLIGRWEGNYSDYPDARGPETWMGSDSIYRHFWKTDKKPVRYGQCWVFGGVLNSALRTLGFAARQLCNFNSACEAPRAPGLWQHVINKYYHYETGEMLHMDGMVWNFHSWNDAWMKRPDMGQLYDGWQGLDATNRFGPAPIHAIHEVEDDVPFDVPIMVSEVNCRIHRYLGRCSTQTINGRKRTHCTRDYDLGDAAPWESLIGGLITTPGVGSGGNELSDIQSLYHPPIPTAPANWINLDLQLTNNMVGSPVQARVTFSAPPTAGQRLTIQYKLNPYLTHYTGSVTGKLLQQTGELELTEDNNYTASKIHEYEFEQYHLRDPVDQRFAFDVFGKVQETSQILLSSETLDIRTPEIQISAPTVITLPRTENRPRRYDASFTFTNPLPIEITDCVLQVQAVDMGLNEKINIDKIDAQATISYSRVFRPTAASAGNNFILAGLECKELNDIHGDANVQVVITQ